MITLNKINKYYKVGNGNFHAIKDIDLIIQDGEFVSLEGESGAGKSTLLNIIGLLDNYDNGEYRFDEFSVENMGDSQMSLLRNTKIGFIMQDFALINGKSVLFNTMLPLLLAKKAPSLSKIKKAALSVLDRVGIADQAKKKVSQLSGGQKQRVAIARALVTNPRLILADEPTGSLDSKNTLQMLEILRDINKQDGITVIIATHSKTVSEFCRRRITLSDGNIIEDCCI